MSFYAFLGSTIFQTSNKNFPQPNTNSIPREANVQSKVVLSASVVGNTVSNLENDVTISLDLNEVCF